MSFEKVIGDPTLYILPSDQATEISERLRAKLSADHPTMEFTRGKDGAGIWECWLWAYQPEDGLVEHQDILDVDEPSEVWTLVVIHEDGSSENSRLSVTGDDGQKHSGNPGKGQYTLFPAHFMHSVAQGGGLRVSLALHFRVTCEV